MRIVLLVFISFLSCFSFAQERSVKLIDDKQEVKEDSRLAITSYNPIFFIYAYENTKAQYSFKYQIFSDMNLYFGFTYLLFWNFDAESKPFIDQNFNPEFFYRYTGSSYSFIDSVDFLLYGHNSNGKEGEDSRSLDFLGVQLNFRSVDIESSTFKSSLRIRYMDGFDDPNKDIQKYQGPWEYKFTLSNFARNLLYKGELIGKIYSGGKYGESFEKGAQEIGFAFRIRDIKLNPSFYIQYFHGFAESLQSYNQEQSTVRVGVLL